MAQRFSGYDRRARCHYPTPAWVTEALLPYLGARRLYLWEPSCGNGEMSAVLGRRHNVISSDIEWPEVGTFWPDDERPSEKRVLGAGPVHKGDFLDETFQLAKSGFDAIVTNPPYGVQGRTAVQFIERALEVVRPQAGLVAMLLKPDFDSASTRTHLFRDHLAWCKKLVLLKRIVWFEPEPDPVTGRANGPSENHCWYIWSWRHKGPAKIDYAE